MWIKTAHLLMGFQNVKLVPRRCFITVVSIISFGVITVAVQFNSHKSVQKLFHNLHIIFSNSLMGFKVICQLEKKKLLKGLANLRKIFS